MKTDIHIATPNISIDKRKVVLEMKDLYKAFGDNKVLNGFNMKLYKGENLVIMGKSGSGKSVMIKCLVGLMQSDSGSIKLMDQELSQMKPEELNVVRADIGFLFQGSALYDSMTVRENLEFPLRRHHNRFPKDLNPEELVFSALEDVGLAHTLDLMPAELSGGMKRRVALARTLILRPKIILYDEPTTGLDPITAKEIILLIKQLQQKFHTSSLIITHDVDCARAISDRMILLIEGRNYIEGTFEELATNKDPKIKAFFKH